MPMTAFGLYFLFYNSLHIKLAHRRVKSEIFSILCDEGFSELLEWYFLDYLLIQYLMTRLNCITMTY